MLTFSPQRLGVYDYFLRALRAGWAAPRIPHEGLVRGEDGNFAGFVLHAHEEVIRRAEYRSTTCATLVGLCEHAASLLAGMTLAEAALLRGESLLELHPEIPRGRWDRADLCIRAVRTAVKIEMDRRGNG